ncbi:MAG: methyltransferase domain-containing protein [Candidatus Aenigmarchaeota archaeon]|nr:methyltransferase domain-containing protein [Candidatus Aenigmarchaeota archaeon]
MMKRLNIGCGTDIKEGWINLDSAAIKGVDVVHDIEKLPLPFKRGEFDEVLCRNILEHVDYIPVLKDIHRIMKNGGRLIITAPHFTSKHNFIDPTHKKMFSISTFDFFVEGSKIRRDYYFGFSFGAIEYSKITFQKGMFLYNHVVEKIVNSSRGMMQFYESTLLSRLFPAQDIEACLVK